MQRDRLHGIPFKGYKLSIMRPPGYREPHEGDPYKSIKPDELKMPQVSSFEEFVNENVLIFSNCDRFGF